MTAKLSIDTIRQRATEFAKKFEGITSEKKHDQNFMRGFCHVFGILETRIDWQYDVKNKNQQHNWIDGLLRGSLLFEIKSAGKNMDEAYHQASGYISLMADKDLPDYVLVSDFTHLHLYNRKTGAPRIETTLADFSQKIEPFLFLADYENIVIEQQEKINKAAAEKMAALHDAIKATGYDGKDLETYLVRLLFCLFAEDTGLFGENNSFLDYLINHTQIDGSDLHGALMALFDTLNKPQDKRLKNLPEHRAKFPYINGALFDGALAECCFDEATRATLIDCAKLDWSEISPAIFGSLFQAIMHFDDEAGKAKTKKRRELGAHYTSEENILKVINPLFMDDLRAEFEKCANSKPKLNAFHQRIAALNFFDPACGCGNFLVIAYRELRLLELQVIKKLYGDNLTGHLDIDTLILCNVDQFHGIEIDDSAAQIATVALWLTDHQMNLKVQDLGLYYHRIPLTKKANIVCANALQIDWAEVITPQRCSFIMGNPPFIGRQYQNEEQKKDLALVFEGMKGAGVLDYVAAWHVTAARYIQVNPKIPVAFVSTNSLTQGEQVAVLWTELLRLGIRLHFAYRTFRWSNEGKGVAAVHCVIMGFSVGANLFALSGDKDANKFAPTMCRLFVYGDDITGQPTEIKAKQINPHLVDAPTVLIEKRRKPLSENAPEMVFGNMPNDGGHLLLSQEEADEIKRNDPIAAKYIRPFLGSEEFINHLSRYCLWLKDSTATDRTQSPEIKKRIEAVKKMRLASSREATKKLADTPYLFGEIRQTQGVFLAIPEVSSEKRNYIPIGYLKDEIASNKLYMIPKATLYDFGVVTSTIHMAWMRAVCGRLESRYQYSAGVVYNNFPFPENVKPATKKKIEDAAQAVLDARSLEEKRCAEQGQSCSLATLYAANNMPEALLKAHKTLDAAVDAAYGYKGNKDDAARVAFLFERYQACIQTTR